MAMRAVLGFFDSRSSLARLAFAQNDKLWFSGPAGIGTAEAVAFLTALRRHD